MLKWVFFFLKCQLLDGGRKVKVKGNEDEEKENKGRWMHAWTTRAGILT